MTRLGYLLSTLVILCCPLTAFSQADFASIEAFLKSTLQGEDRLSIGTEGDLNGDGLLDWVGVIHRQRSDLAPTYQLYLLLRLGEGGYRVAEKTQEAEIPGMGCCWLEDLKIRRGSVYVQNNAKTASTMEAATHQFKLHRGEWRLVGLTIYLTDHSPTAPMTMDTDVNLLTGLVIEKTQKGNKKPTTRRRQKKSSLFLLKDFDFSNGFGIQ
jgi:hypothetical protein